jgi:hypothetical protein
MVVPSPIIYGRRSKFQNFPSHAYGYLGEGIAQNNSLDYFQYIVFQLVNGDYFYYVNQFPMTNAEQSALEARILTFPSPNNRVGYFGEAYNYIIRPHLQFKFTADEFITFLDA